MANKEFEFYLNVDLKKYQGKYIALVGNKIVASGDNAKQVWQEAKTKTGKIPTIAKVPREEALVFKLKWN